MSMLNFDIAFLRSYVAGIELGSFVRAADKVGRSTSAVSAQLKKLEEQAGVPLFRKDGRGLALTPAGEVLLGYARRLLELNDEAAVALRGVELEGWIRLGLQEDFGEALLPEVLGRFARAHPKVRIEAHVACNTALLERLSMDQLDLALLWGGAGIVGLDGYPLHQRQRIRERLRILMRHQQAVATMFDHLLHTRRTRADGGATRGHAFNERQGHALEMRGQHTDLMRHEQAGHVLVVPEKFHLIIEP